MDEGLPQFVQRRRPDWERLARLLDGLARRRLRLDELQALDGLYRRTASDLAHANTFFPGSEAQAHLNGLCARGYASIYQQRPSRAKALRRFFANDFPGTFVAEVRFFVAALCLLLAGALVGAVAALSAPESIRALVPDDLWSSIDRGVLWTDSALSATSPLVLGSHIITNNVGVALSLFGLGLTFGLGTAVGLFANGLHLGAVLALCFRAKLGVGLLGFMVAHGFVELTAVLIAGQAGLILGAALVDPGELTRADALRLRGRRALRLLMGTVPLLFGIGLVEGYVSPGELFPGWLKLVLGLALAGLVYGYLVRAGRAATLPDER